MLDGGYIFITLLEMITRRRFSDKVIERVNTVGFYFVLALMALGIFNGCGEVHLLIAEDPLRHSRLALFICDIAHCKLTWSVRCCRF